MQIASVFSSSIINSGNDVHADTKQDEKTQKNIDILDSECVIYLLNIYDTA